MRPSSMSEPQSLRRVTATPG